MRTNLAERIGIEPEEVTEERQRRIWEAYQTRKAMRRLERLGCVWISGVGFALCIIAGCAHAAEIAAVLGVSISSLLNGCMIGEDFSQRPSRGSESLGQSVAALANGCSSTSQRLMLELCRAVAQSDKLPEADTKDEA